MSIVNQRSAAAGNESKAADQELASLLADALRLYGTRILDNVDLARLPDLRSRAAVAARATMERGDARAFVLGRRMLDRVEARAARRAVISPRADPEQGLAVSV